MSEMKLDARIKMRHDTEANWLLAINFIPLFGEIIVYDVDSTHDNPRIKIGDGVTIVNNLPFLSAESSYNKYIWVGSDVPNDSSYVIWIDPQSGGGASFEEDGLTFVGATYANDGITIQSGSYDNGGLTVGAGGGGIPVYDGEIGP